MTSALSRQEGGTHYRDCAIQPAEYTHANGLGHMEGDAIAYITRWRAKGGLADIDKAIHSLQILKELEQRKQERQQQAEGFDALWDARRRHSIVGGFDLNAPGGAEAFLAQRAKKDPA